MIYKEIDLTVLADRRCTTSIFYLEYLYRSGYKPKKIYVCNFLYKPSFQSRKERVLYTIPKLYKMFAKISYPKINSFSQDLMDEMQSAFDFKINLDLHTINYNNYSDQVEYITAWNYQDFSFQKRLFKDKKTFYLYTNGGIVPRKIFDENIKILHVHPGIVPDIRGSDCLLWSLLEREKLGYSCFFMNAGIDTGDVLYQQEFDPIRFPKLFPLYENYSQDVYTSLLKAFDPHFRGKILVSTIQAVNGNLDLLEGKKQNSLLGREFFSMHPLLVKKCLKKFF